ncbi:MAG: NAD(P)/FAD-dependent oxidoreductase [Phycisphaerales bacterium]
MKIAVVGAGVAGLTCAAALHAGHDLTLFEREAHLGGHARTVDVEHEQRRLAVDTGFIVYNERNYPAFTAMLARLGVETQPAPMTFSVRNDADGFEFGGTALGLFAQPSNLFSLRHWRLLAGIRGLGREGKALLAAAPPEMTIGDLCASGRLSRDVLDRYLLPMASAIWSAPREGLMDFPVRFFLRFFDNHGMLDLRERPRWRTIAGGSREYVARLVEPFRARCRTGCQVRTIRRQAGEVVIESSAGRESFDQVILACHADEALEMLDDVRTPERAILGAMPFQSSDTVLHRDARALPRSRRAWSGWNYRVRAVESGGPSVTYNLTMLQTLRTRVPICVTLNDRSLIDPGAVLGRFDYHHPQYTVAGMAARARWREISGLEHRTHYCGAYWFNGFHEDGVQSGLRVAAAFGAAA